MKVNSRVRDGVMIVSVSGRVLLPRTDVFAAWVTSEVGERLLREPPLKPLLTKRVDESTGHR